MRLATPAGLRSRGSAGEPVTAAGRPPAGGRGPGAGSRPGVGTRSGVRPAVAAAARSTAPDRAVRTRRTTRLAILGLIGLAIVVAVAPTLRVYVHQRSQIAALEARQADQRQEVAALQAQAKRWNDPAYVESQARARLQFVRPGQRSYVVAGARPKAAVAPASGIVAGTTGSAGRSWMDGLWQSIQKAGASPAAAVK
jgi:cell division protein FtsB